MREMRSLFLVSWVESPSTSMTLWTCDSEERCGAVEIAGVPVGLGDAILGDLDSGRVCRGTAWAPAYGLAVSDVAAVSSLSDIVALADLRCLSEGRATAGLLAAAAATPAPPLRRAFFRRSVASSKAAFTSFRFLTGGSLMTSAKRGANSGSNTPSILAPSVGRRIGEAGGDGSDTACRRSDESGRAYT